MSLLQRWEKFWWAPASARPLAVLRIGLAGLLFFQAWSLRNVVTDLFSQHGILQGKLAEALGEAGTPKIALLVERLAPYGYLEAGVLDAAGFAYLLSLLLLAAGLLTRLSAGIAFFLHWTWMSSGFTAAYGVDAYAHVFLFYLMFVPCGQALSLDALLGRGATSSGAARAGLRVLQLHLCISYLASAIEKSKCAQWWNGEVIWRSLNLPVYQQFDFTWLANYPWLAAIGSCGALLLEFTYAVLIWPRRTRLAMVAGIVALHLGIAIFLGLTYFGLVMCVLTIAAFGVSAEPERRRARVRTLVPSYS